MFLSEIVASETLVVGIYAQAADLFRLYQFFVIQRKQNKYYM